MNKLLFVLATTLLVHRAYTRRSLTRAGIVAAVLTASLHAYNPWNAPFVLLITFYLLGTAATRVKHGVKARLTLSASGEPGGEGARGWVQVVANSVVASGLAVVHACALARGGGGDGGRGDGGWELDRRGLLYLGIVANYAATTADTLSSELGILSPSRPRLITSPSRPCPPGTNGGVTLTGLISGTAGALTIALVAALLTPFSPASVSLAQKAAFVAVVTTAGVVGTLLDSLLGALLQESVLDVRSGKVVEAPGGGRVLVHPGEKDVGGSRGHATESRTEVVGGKKVEGKRGKEGVRKEPGQSRIVFAGRGVLTNNGVNLAMAASVSVGTMALAGWWIGEGPMAWAEEAVRAVTGSWSRSLVVS